MRKIVPIVAVAGVLLLAGCTATPRLTDSDYLRLVKQNVSELADHSNTDIRKDGAVGVRIPCHERRVGAVRGRADSGWVHGA